MARSDAVILMGGPMHRRVYFDGVPANVPYRDSGRYSTKTLGIIYPNLTVKSAVRDVVPRVWEWTGTEQPSRPARALPAGGGFPRTCTRLGCEERATVALAGNLERFPWYACEEHKAQMTSALAVGRSIDYSVDPTPL